MLRDCDSMSVFSVALTDVPYISFVILFSYRHSNDISGQDTLRCLCLANRPVVAVDRANSL